MLLFLALLFPLPLFCYSIGFAAEPLPQVATNIFSPAGETMHFSISWSGGVKIGDLHLVVRPYQSEKDTYTVHARVTDYGLFHLFCPVDDTFTTLMRGNNFLPFRYDVLQKEGYSSDTRRRTLYDQETYLVRYTKNDEPERDFQVNGPVHNEFSSFFFSRMLDFQQEREIVVPTFADEKRNLVKVLVKEAEELSTIFGKQTTIPVMPIMKFKGLYDKAGDTVIWFTDDDCRIPVKINSKILIGSLTAELVSYQNERCENRQPQ
jgi:hypothetical protein